MYGAQKKGSTERNAQILLAGGTALAAAAGFGISSILLGTVCAPGADMGDISAGAAGLSGIFAYILIVLRLVRGNRCIKK